MGETYSSGKVKTIMELFTLERLESLYTKFETCRNEFNVGSFLQCVVYYSLVLVDGDGASGVDYVSTSSGVWVT